MRKFTSSSSSSFPFPRYPPISFNGIDQAFHGHIHRRFHRQRGTRKRYCGFPDPSNPFLESQGAAGAGRQPWTRLTSRPPPPSSTFSSLAESLYERARKVGVKRHGKDGHDLGMTPPPPPSLFLPGGKLNGDRESSGNTTTTPTTDARADGWTEDHHRSVSTSSPSSSFSSSPTATHVSPERAAGVAMERSNDFFRFEILHHSNRPGSRARVGRLVTPHGTVTTPCFVPVATNAALKALDFPSADQEGCGLTFCNTYHLMLHPGVDTVAKLGGLHAFTNRSGRPFITDSGGFQIFSLMSDRLGSVFEQEGNESSRGRKKGSVSTTGEGDHLRGGGGESTAFQGRGKEEGKNGQNGRRGQNSSVLALSELGVEFVSYRDGTHVLLTPEGSIQAQAKLGADIILPLDELLPFSVSDRMRERSLALTHRWQARSLEEHLRLGSSAGEGDDGETNSRQQAIFCIVHGGTSPYLRRFSTDLLSRFPFDGFAIGGSLGATRRDVIAILNAIAPLLRPFSRPVHLLGIGDVPTAAAAVQYGVDSFDSAFPTRIARHGRALVRVQGAGGDLLGSSSSFRRSLATSGLTPISGEGGSSPRGLAYLDIRKSRFREDDQPLDHSCGCPVCSGPSALSRAYLHHLFRAKESVLGVFLTQHNLRQMNDMAAGLRDDILHDRI